MKWFCFVILMTKYSFGDVDIFNKCPDFRPKINFDIEEVTTVFSFYETHESALC